MPKTIKLTVDSPESIADAIAELQKYADDLPKKADAIAHALAELGYTVAVGILSQHVFSGETLESLTVKQEGEGKYVLFAESEAILFIEFGAGVRAGYHPWNGEYGMGAGTYPGQTHALDPHGWWFPTDDPRLILRTNEKGQGFGHSYGNPAYMPFGLSHEAIKRDLLSVAKGVFGNV